MHYLTFPDGAFHEEIVIHLNPHLDYFISLLDPHFLFLSNPLQYSSEIFNIFNNYYNDIEILGIKT